MHETNVSLHCTQCGKNISGSSRFCDQCGSPVRLAVQPVAQQQAARRSNAGQFMVILVIVALFGVVIFVIALSKQGTSTDTNGTNNSTQSTAHKPIDNAVYCKDFPFDEKCPNHDQHKPPAIGHQPNQLHPDGESVVLPEGQAGRDEFARRVNDTGEGVIRAHAKGETLIVESEAFDESINRRHFRQLLLGGTGETYKETDGKLCGLGFSELRLVGPTKVEEKLIPCG